MKELVTPENLAIVGAVVIALAAAAFLKAEAKDVLVAIGGGLIGFLGRGLAKNG